MFPVEFSLWGEVASRFFQTIALNPGVISGFYWRQLVRAAQISAHALREIP
jgi:hypothetical protein